MAAGYAQNRAVSVRMRCLLPRVPAKAVRRTLAVGGLAAAGWMLGTAGQAHADAAPDPVRAVQCTAGEGVEPLGRTGGQSAQRSPLTDSSAIPAPPAHPGARTADCTLGGFRSVSRAPGSAKTANFAKPARTAEIPAEIAKAQAASAANGARDTAGTTAPAGLPPDRFAVATRPARRGHFRDAKAVPATAIVCLFKATRASTSEAADMSCPQGSPEKAPERRATQGISAAPRLGVSALAPAGVREETCPLERSSSSGARMPCALGAVDAVVTQAAVGRAATGHPVSALFAPVTRPARTVRGPERVGEFGADETVVAQAAGRGVKGAPAERLAVASSSVRRVHFRDAAAGRCAAVVGGKAGGASGAGGVASATGVDRSVGTAGAFRVVRVMDGLPGRLAHRSVARAPAVKAVQGLGGGLGDAIRGVAERGQGLRASELLGVGALDGGPGLGGAEGLGRPGQVGTENEVKAGRADGRGGSDLGGTAGNGLIRKLGLPASERTVSPQVNGLPVSGGGGVGGLVDAGNETYGRNLIVHGRMPGLGAPAVRSAAEEPALSPD